MSLKLDCIWAIKEDLFMLSSEQRKQYEADGYWVVRGLFQPEDIAAIRAHYETMHAAGNYQESGTKPDMTSDDPLKRYPRIMHPHRYDEASLRWLLDDRLRIWLTELLGLEPYAVQSMYYFKPPKARGQALHQDNYHLKVNPGTCMAAWIAVDECDAENGCLQVIPGTHDMPELCTVEADRNLSFSKTALDLPQDLLDKVVPVEMQPGDVLFFNGQLIHGSYPNTSDSRWRRSLIMHYIVGDAEQVGVHYHPVLRFDGSVATEVGLSDGSSTCGIWTDRQGAPVLEMSGTPDYRNQEVGA
jgi:phytanoyl-CoA hydroxylase